MFLLLGFWKSFLNNSPKKGKIKKIGGNNFHLQEKSLTLVYLCVTTGKPNFRNFPVHVKLTELLKKITNRFQKNIHSVETRFLLKIKDMFPQSD